jgi:DNA polymerase-3 subunit gamma/tau
MHTAAAQPPAVDLSPAGPRSGATAAPAGPGNGEGPAAGAADRIEAAPAPAGDAARAAAGDANRVEARAAAEHAAPEANKRTAQGSAQGPAQAGGAAGLPTGQADWNDLVGVLGLKGAARQFAGSCHLDRSDGDVLQLTLDRARQHLYTDTLRDKLGRALADHFGRQVRVQVEIGKVGAETLAQRRDREAAERQREAVATIAKDPNVAALKETFAATVDESSIRPR